MSGAFEDCGSYFTGIYQYLDSFRNWANENKRMTLFLNYGLCNLNCFTFNDFNI